MIGMTKAIGIPGWVPWVAAKARKAAERLEERRRMVLTGRYFPGGLPTVSTRMAEGIIVAVVALVIKSAPVSTTAELGMILFTISLGVLLVLGLAEFRAWRRWSRG
jgi:hypothetical protein